MVLSKLDKKEYNVRVPPVLYFPKSFRASAQRMQRKLKNRNPHRMKKTPSDYEPFHLVLKVPDKELNEGHPKANIPIPVENRINLFKRSWMSFNSSGYRSFEQRKPRLRSTSPPKKERGTQRECANLPKSMSQ
ncbi:hypothetical protein CDAR_252501 [Caerostris darwini]|uniref:Uncharacterized protein n=1 Tax=Caerostris darwini TaxID=1538125 RepID=A0AAV4WIV8_9ARAC|nr:hypothetical protein CDAR_252501 [Caerostris darwini]